MFSYILSVLLLNAGVNKLEPCQELTASCVSHFLSVASDCTPVDNKRSVERHVETYIKIESPYANATYTRENMRIDGLSKGIITSFYCDIEANEIVINIHFPELILSGTETINFHRFDQPDKAVTTPFKQHLYDLKVSSHFKGLTKYERKSLRTYAFPGEIEFDLDDSPDLEKAAEKDPFIKKALNVIFDNIDILAIDEGTAIGKVAASAFIDKALCKPKSTTTAKH